MAERQRRTSEAPKRGGATERRVPPAEIDQILDKAIQRESKYFRMPKGNRGNPS